MEEQKLDYPRIYERLDSIIDSVMDEISNWCDLNNQQWRTGCSLLNYPPRIHLEIELDPISGKRAKKFLRAQFNPVLLGFSDVDLQTIMHLCYALMKKFNLTTWGERTDHTLHFYFRLKVPSYVYDTGADVAGEKEAVPPKEKT